MYYVYVLRSVNYDRFYIGIALDVEDRLKQHNAGKTRSTRPYKPWKLFFFEAKNDRAQAREREKFLKSGIGREYIKDKWTRSLTEYLPAGQCQ